MIFTTPVTGENQKSLYLSKTKITRSQTQANSEEALDASVDPHFHLFDLPKRRQ